MDQLVIVLAIIFVVVALLFAMFFAYAKVMKNKDQYASGRTQNGDIYLDDVCSKCSKYLKLTNIK